MSVKSKQVIITAAARQAIDEGMPEAEALALHGQEVTAEGEGATTPEGEETAGTEGVQASSDGGEDPGSEASGTEAAEGEATSPAAAADTSAVVTLSGQVAALTGELAETKLKLTQAETNATTMGATHAGLMAIVMSRVNQMQISLGGSSQDLAHLDATALLAQHASIHTTYEKRFPVGGVSSVNLDKPEVITTDEVQAAAHTRAVSFTPTTEDQPS